jgi:hypothetical protein
MPTNTPRRERVRLTEGDDDNAAKAKAALASVEVLTAEVRILETKVRMTLEAWVAYGQALLDQRRRMPDKVAFGRWVKANNLDTGLARHSKVRSDAIWLANYWYILKDFKTNQTHPTGIRQTLGVEERVDDVIARKEYQAAMTCLEFAPTIRDPMIDIVVPAIRDAMILANRRMRQFGNLKRKDITDLRASLQTAVEALTHIDECIEAGTPIYVEPTEADVKWRIELMERNGKQCVWAPSDDEDLLYSHPKLLVEQARVKRSTIFGDVPFNFEPWGLE